MITNATICEYEQKQTAPILLMKLTMVSCWLFDKVVSITIVFGSNEFKFLRCLSFLSCV